MIKLIMKMSGGETDTRKEVVYTDWEQVANFAREIAHLTDKTDAEISIKNKKMRGQKNYFKFSSCQAG